MEATDHLQQGRSLRDLPKVGAWLNVIIRRWLEDPPEVPEPDPLRHGFLLGHPRGRIYNFRAGLWADWPRVFAAAAATR